MLLERRIASWTRLTSLREILAAVSLEEIRSLVLGSVSTEHRHQPVNIAKLRLSTDEVRRLVRALFRSSAARSTLLRDLN